MKTKLWLAGSVAALLALSANARAGAEGAPPAPPAEALQACASAQVGATCSFTAQDGRQVSGTCRSGPRGEAAACMPAGPHRGHHGPPPEALQACSGAQAEASCSFALPDGVQVAGTCRAGPDGAALACAPSQPPPRQ
ncbi:MAG TPA: hypothetical protein VF341_04230 [Anaeromyxobacteraceae bacterium]